NPNKFFKEKISKEIKLIPPAIIVLVAGIIGAISSAMLMPKIMGALPKEAAPFTAFVVVAGAFSALVVVFLMWLIYAGVFYVISIAFHGEGSFKRVFEFVGYGFIPTIVSSVIGLIAMIYVLPTMEFSFEDPQMIQQSMQAMMNNPVMQASSIIGILLTLWSANIWIFGIMHARKLSIRNAVITVGIPIGIYLIYIIYKLL
ncbi:MAG: YIP1 family protein, partial [Methanosarcinales archaeon]